MSQSNKLPWQRYGVSQPRGQQIGGAQPHQAGVMQPKLAMTSQVNKPPVPPPVYRPQAGAKIVQPHMAHAAKPQTKQPVAPPVYRPQPLPKVLQTKSAAVQSSSVGQAPRPPLAAPVRRPEPGSFAQSKVISEPRKTHAAPSVYRPEQKRSVQPKLAAASQMPRPPVAPPVYRPQPPSRIVQTKNLQTRAVAHAQHQTSRAGNRAASPARPGFPRPTPTQPASRTIQRMIAVGQKDQLDTMADYAVLKVLSQLVQHEYNNNKPTQIVELKGADFSTVKAGETLYIVGHGCRGDGNINDVGVQPETLAKMIGKIKTKIAGIVVLTCYSGSDYNNAALVDKIKDALTVQGIPVTGMNGFSYGSPDTKATGLNSVLPSTLSNAYSGEDLNALIAELGTHTPTGPGVGKIYGKSFLNQNKTLAQQLTGGELAKGAKSFLARRNAIENKMKKIVANTGGNDLNAKVNALNSDKKFQQLVSQQHFLFTDSGLFDPDAVKTVTS